MILRERQITREMLAEISQAHGIGIPLILGSSRELDVVKARKAVIVQLRRRGLTLKQIGRQMGIHHTSVHYHLRDEFKARVLEAWRPDESGIWAI